MLALRTLSRQAREVIIDGFGRWLPSHIAMRFREIQGFNHSDPLDDLISNGLLITARSNEEFLEVFGMAEMMVKCQELLVDRGSMARFFIAVGHALYTTRHDAQCLVEYGHDIAISFGPQEPHKTLSLTLSRHGEPTVMDQTHNPSDPELKHKPTRSFEEREVQTDLETRDELRVVHSDSHVPELGLHAALYIKDGHPAMQQVSIDDQSDSDRVLQADQDRHCTYTVGCQIEGPSLSYYSSHVPDARHQADIIIVDGQPLGNMVPVPIDLQSDYDVVPLPDDDGLCTSTVGSSIQGESLIHSRGHITEAAGIVDFTIHDCYPSSEGFPMDLESDSEVVVRSNEDGYQGESFISTSSHVPEPDCQAAVNIDDGQSSMQSIQIDMQTDSAVGLNAGIDDLHARTVGSPFQIVPSSVF